MNTELPSTHEQHAVSTTTSDESNRPSLVKALGKWSAMALVVGAVIGSGIFAKPGANAMVGNSVGLIMVAWTVGGIITVIGGVCLAELALMMPKAGGTYVYIRQAYGRIPAFLAGWNESVFFQSCGNSALAIFFVINLSSLLGVEFSNVQTVGTAISLIAILTVVNCLGVFWGGLVQNITTVIKVGFLALIALLPILLLFVEIPEVQATNYTANFSTDKTPDSLVMIFTLVMLNVMWAYSGGWMVTGIAEEIKEPQKNLSLALIGGAIVLFVIYIAVNIAFHGALSLEQMVEIENDPVRLVPQEAISIYLTPVNASLGQLAKAVLSSVILVSVFSALNTGLLTPPRVLFAMARDEMFIPAFAKIHPRFKTPHIAVMGQGLVTVILLLIVSGYVVYRTNQATDSELPSSTELLDASVSTAAGGLLEPDTRQRATVIRVDATHVFVSLGGSNEGVLQRVQLRRDLVIGVEFDIIVSGYNHEQQIYDVLPTAAGSEAKEIFDYLTNIAVFSATIFIVLTIGAIFILRRKHPDMERPYKVPGYPIIPLISLIANAIFLYLVGSDNIIVVLFSGGFLLCSLPLYFLF
ncbi:MAG: amino acid permease, partial [Planctomycetaceae bacterium]|nr:amino acid permease [Planctomycetaceae bacterium]